MDSLINKAVDKVIEDYGCVLVALGRDDMSVIEECRKTGHKKYHKKQKTALK